MQERRRYSEELTCSLTEEEVTAAGQALAHLLQEQEQMEEEHAEIKERMKGEASNMSARRKRIESKLRTGEELRQVEVIEYLNGKRIVTVRTDTGEQVRDRAARPEELQGSIPGLDLGDPDPGDDFPFGAKEDRDA